MPRKRIAAPVETPRRKSKKQSDVTNFVMLAGLVKEVEEVKGDLSRLVDLLAEQFGEPFRSRAEEVVQKYQGKK